MASDIFFIWSQGYLPTKQDGYHLTWDKGVSKYTGYDYEMSIHSFNQEV